MKANEVTTKYALVFRARLNLGNLLKTFQQEAYQAKLAECTHKFVYGNQDLQMVVVSRKRLDTPANNLLTPNIPLRWRQEAIAVIELDTLAGYCNVKGTFMAQELRDAIAMYASQLPVYDGPLGVLVAEQPAARPATPKYKHVLIYPHRTDLLERLHNYGHAAYAEEFSESINILDFDNVLYKLLTVDLPMPMELCGQKDLAVHADWRKDLVAAYRLESSQVHTAVPRAENDRGLRLFINLLIDHLPTYTGPMAYLIGTKQQSS